MRTLLFSYAHPDDESFAGAGLAARCKAEGIRVVLVTATRGEGGSAGDPPLCTRDELPARREAELREAAAIIGIDALHVLGYRDRLLSDVAPDEIRRTLITLLRSHRPDVVVTFDPNGANLHPDHVAISRFTSDAVSAAADPRWYAGIAPAHGVRRLLWTPPVVSPATLGERDLAAKPGFDMLIDTTRWRDLRAAALRAHRTQHVSIEKHFFGHSDVDRILSREAYRQAWGPAIDRRPTEDIWDGLA